MALVLLPGFALGIRNAKVGEGFVFLAHEASLDAYRGNHVGSDGSSHVLPGTRVAPLPAGDSALAYASRQAARELKAGEAGAWFASAVWSQWRNDPGGSVGRLFLKVGRLVGARERDGDRTLVWWRSQSPVLSLPIFTGWAVLFSLGLAGLFGLPRRENATPVILSLALIAVSLLFLVVNERTRLPLAYLLAVTAGIPVARAIEAFRARRLRAAMPLFLLVIVLAAVSGIDRMVGVPDAKVVRAAGFVEAGELLLRQRDWYQSLPWFRDAIADSEVEGEASSATARAARLGMVRALMNTQRAEDADQHLAVLERLYPEDTEVLAMRGRYHLRRHDIKRAHPIFNEVLSQDPYRLEARLGLGWAQMENQAYRAALITFEGARNLDMRNAELLAGIGAAALETTDNEGRAKRLMWRALGLDWRTYQAHQYLGSMARATRDIPVMLYHLRECLRLDPHNDGVRRFLTRTGAGLEHTPDVTRPPSPFATSDAD